MFRAIDLRTGRVRWETKLSREPGQYFFHGDPVTIGDVIVIASDAAQGAHIHGVDQSSGKELWRHALGRGAKGPLAAAAGRAYVSTLDGQLMAFDARSGAIGWSIDINVPGWEGPAATSDGVFAGTVEGLMYRLKPEDGQEQWRTKLSAGVSATPLVVGGDLYVGTADGMLHRIDQNTGAISNSLRLDTALTPKSVPMKTQNAILVLMEDTSADNRALVSMDATLKNVRWRVSAPSPWTTSRVFVWGDVTVAGTGSGEVTAYCTDTGAPAWTRTIKGKVRSIGGADDTLLVSTPTGDLYAMPASRSCDPK